MLCAYVRRFDVTYTIENFLATKHGLNLEAALRHPGKQKGGGATRGRLSDPELIGHRSLWAVYFSYIGW